MKKSRETRTAEQWLIRRHPHLRRVLRQRGFVTFAGGKGGGSATQTTTIPDELKPLISSSVSGALALQPGARDFMQAVEGAFRGNPEAQRLQIAPLTSTEQGLIGRANDALNYLGYVPSGFYQANQALNLQGPLNQLAATQVVTPQAEQWLNTLREQGFDVLNQPLNSNAATGAFYSTLSGAQTLLGERVGPTSQEQTATNAYSLLPLIAGQAMTTPGAESQALQGITALTSGALGESPATREAIAALEREYETRALPSLQNQLAQAGLGRSGALEQGIIDLRGKLFEAEVPLLMKEMDSRQNVLPILNQIASAQTARESLPTERLIQALGTQGAGLSSLGGQLGSRTAADIQRDITAQLGLTQPLIGQQQFEQATQMAPREEELQYIESWMNPLTAMASQQQTRSQIPIERQISTALQAAPQFEALNQAQLDTAAEISKIGALPRLQQQAINEARLQNELRIQALVESILLGPLGMMPSMLGTQTVTKGGGK